MKTLIVSCILRGEISRTLQLVRAFEAAIADTDEEIEHLDLTADVPDFLLPERLSAYSRRNYRGETLTAQDTALLRKMDRMTAQLLAADTVVVAFPMYNFSCPALVKAYLDSVALKGETWDIDKGRLYGLCEGKRALILTTSGNDYSAGPQKIHDHAASLALANFEFMGFNPIEVVRAEGMNFYPPDKVEKIVAAAQKQIEEIAGRWYSGEQTQTHA